MESILWQILWSLAIVLGGQMLPVLAYSPLICTEWQAPAYVHAKENKAHKRNMRLSFYDDSMNSLTHMAEEDMIVVLHFREICFD